MKPLTRFLRKPRSVYFTLFIVLVAQGRFSALQFKDEFRFSDFQVGLIFGLGVFASNLTTPFFTKRADVLFPAKVLVELLVAHLFVSAMLMFAPLIKEGDGRFAYVFVVRFISSGLINPAVAVLDAMTVMTIPDKANYGNERLYGAVSWAIFSVILGGLADILLNTSVTLYPLLEISMFFLMFATAATIGVVRIFFYPTPLVFRGARVAVGDDDDDDADERDAARRSTFIPVSPEEERDARLRTMQSHRELDASQMTSEPSLFRFVRRADVRTMAVFFVALVLGGAMSLVENLVFLFLRDELNASLFVCGISVVITVLFEIPIFYRSKEVLARFKMPTIVLIGMAGYVVRVVFYTLAETPLLVLFMEPLHGLTYGFVQIGLVSYISDVSARGDNFQVTAQGALNVVRDCGRLFGTVFGSYVMETYGSKLLYRSAGGIVFVSGAFLWVVFRLTRARFEDEVVAAKEESAERIGSDGSGEAIDLESGSPDRSFEMVESPRGGWAGISKREIKEITANKTSSSFATGPETTTGFVFEGERDGEEEEEMMINGGDDVTMIPDEAEEAEKGTVSANTAGVDDVERT